MPASCADPVLTKLATLRVELIDQAWALERQGRLDAADVAVAISVRIAELCAELEPAKAAG